MKTEQWTVLGLLIALASLEVIRSPNVRGFFNNFFGQFGIGSIPSPTPPPHVNAPGSSDIKKQQSTQKVRGIA